MNKHHINKTFYILHFNKIKQRLIVLEIILNGQAQVRRCSIVYSISFPMFDQIKFNKLEYERVWGLGHNCRLIFAISCFCSHDTLLCIYTGEWQVVVICGGVVIALLAPSCYGIYVNLCLCGPQTLPSKSQIKPGVIIR